MRCKIKKILLNAFRKNKRSYRIPSYWDPDNLSIIFSICIVVLISFWTKLWFQQECHFCFSEITTRSDELYYLDRSPYKLFHGNCYNFYEFLYYKKLISISSVKNIQIFHTIFVLYCFIKNVSIKKKIPDKNISNCNYLQCS